MEYDFVVFVTPVGPYFKGGIRPVETLITREYDRAAPLGTGRLKVGGNYAASLRAIIKARELRVMGILYFWMPERKNILMSVVLPTFSGLRGTHILHPNREAYWHRLLTRA